MKKSLILLLGVTLCTGACTAYVAGPRPRAAVVYAGPTAVVVEDQSYYVRGPGYYSRGVHYVWVGGHWARRHGHRAWIHGRYVGR
jgi:hypothetical protein